MSWSVCLYCFLLRLYFYFYPSLLVLSTVNGPVYERIEVSLHACHWCQCTWAPISKPLAFPPLPALWSHGPAHRRDVTAQNSGERDLAYFPPPTPSRCRAERQIDRARVLNATQHHWTYWWISAVCASTDMDSGLDSGLDSGEPNWLLKDSSSKLTSLPGKCWLAGCMVAYVCVLILNWIQYVCWSWLTCDKC